MENLESISSLIWRRFKKHKLALLSLIILFLFCTLSLLAPLLERLLGVSHMHASTVGVNMSSSWRHILGTNELGQDVFMRIIYGGRISLSVGILSAVTSALIGTIIGLLAGFFGGRIDSILMRFTDAMLSIPVLPLMIVFAALDLTLIFKIGGDINLFFIFLLILGIALFFRFFTDKTFSLTIFFDSVIFSGFFMGIYYIFFRLINWESLNSGNFSSVVKLIMIIVFFGWMTVARLARASALQLKNMEFVIAAKALGASNKKVIFSHILPNSLAPIIVAATLEVGGNILYEAALSFLGLGIQPPVSSWGNMLNNAVEYIKSSPALAFWPGLVILTTVSCFNFLGDGMRDALDPHQVMKKTK